jgi:hypothetical protein
MSIVLVGSTSGSITLQEPAVAGTTVLDLPATSGTVLTSTSPSSSLPSSINGPAFSVYSAAAQTIGTTVNTKVTFDTEEFDTNNNFASSRFTPTVAGYYQVQGSVRVGSSATTMRLMIWKNGGQYKLGTDINTVVNNGFVSTLVYCNGTTDYVELYVLLGAGQNTSGGGTSEIWFNGSMVRAA